MGGGRREQHRIGSTGKESSQAVSQMPFRHAGASYVVCLIDDHTVPSRVLQEMAIAADILQRVDADDDAVVYLEGILVCGYTEPQFRNAGGVKSYERDAESIPQLRLELSQHGLLRQHSYAIGPAAAHQLGQNHTHLYSLAETDSIAQQQSGAKLL